MVSLIYTDNLDTFGWIGLDFVLFIDPAITNHRLFGLSFGKTNLNLKINYP